MAAATHIEVGIEHALSARRGRRDALLPNYSPASLDEIKARLGHVLTASFPAGFRVADFRPLTGGASKQHFVFDLEEAGGARRSLVLRAELSECLVTCDMRREAEIQRAIRGIVPVPEIVCADPSGELFGSPAMVSSLVRGTTVPPETAGKPSGFGTCFSPARRATLATDFVENLARIHLFADTPAASSMESFERPREGTTEAADWLLAWWRRVWDLDALEDHPMIEVAFDWLEEHAPNADRISFLHGDYRTGNFLFDPEANRITAILDWEMCRFGDRHEDLGWTLARIYAARDDDGTELVCGLAPRDWLLRRYTEITGLAIDPERLFFYEVANELKIAVIALGSGPRNASERRSHAHLSNLIFAPAGYRCLARLHELLAPRLEN